MIDNLKAMAFQTDAELSRRLGVDLDWSQFVADILLQRGERSDNGLFEDMVTDIVTGILMALDGENALSEKVAWCKATSHDEASLLNKLKPVMSSAVHYRFRDFRDRSEYNIGRGQMPEDSTFEPVSYDWPVGSELDAEALQSMIEAELSERHAKATGMQRTVLEKAKVMLPDRIEGMGLREICEKHGWGRGKMTSLALNEVFSAVESVIHRLQEGWMLALLK